MGSAAFLFPVADRDYDATELSALVLAQLKRDAECAIGETITDAVITVPAYFRNPQREATITAGQMAGLKVLQVVNEPTAAAVAYGMKASGNERLILVYDLGGGTFDVTLMRIGAGEIRILSSEGDQELGGKDWDDRILDFLATRFREEFGSDPLEDAECLSDLLVRAEEAKKRLAITSQVTVSIVHDGYRGRYLLTRAILEQITADLLERTASLCRKVLDESGVAPAELDGVLLVGGSTRMAAVHALVTQLAGKPPLGGINVDEAVALGAALIAEERRAETAAGTATFALSGRIRAIDVTNHSLGMIALNEAGTAFVNSIILPKNRPIPCTESRPYQHRTASGHTLEVYVTQGESDSPADVTYLGRYLVHDLPAGRAGLTVLDIGYTYDHSGTVQVGARNRDDGRELVVSVEALPEDVPDRFLAPPRQTAATPVHTTAYLAFDLSGSMAGAPLAEAKRAAMGFLRESDLAHSSIGIIAFSDTSSVKLKATGNARHITAAIDDLWECETGITNLGDPFEDVHSLLAETPGRRFAIILADGCWANQEGAIEHAKRCHHTGIEVIAIGFGDADPQFLTRIASSDRASFFTTQDGLVEAFCSVAQVLTESVETAPSGRGLSFFSRDR